jgi:hypothetical protein
MSDLEQGQKGKQRGFRLILKWSLIMLVLFTTLGIFQRIVSPVERYLDEEEYRDKIFLGAETDAWNAADSDATVATLFEPGTILYVIAEDSLRVQVRPFLRSQPDSVWIDPEHAFLYDEKVYRDWMKDLDRRVYRELGSDD